MDKELRNKGLEDLHMWLKENISSYIALCEAGSTTAGDPWVDSHTDRDISIVVKTLTDDMQESIRLYLKGRFGAAYLFIIFDEATFLDTTNEQDLSQKFRGETLYGEDVIARKEVPPQEFAKEIAQKGLRTIEIQLRTRLMNAEHWSVEHLREYMYPQYKKLIMYLATKKYADTGTYPCTRLDVAEAYGSNDIKEVVATIKRIDSTTVEELINVTKKAINIARVNL